MSVLAGVFGCKLLLILRRTLRGIENENSTCLNGVKIWPSLWRNVFSNVKNTGINEFFFIVFKSFEVISS